jgi:hypothetical protein
MLPSAVREGEAARLGPSLLSDFRRKHWNIEHGVMNEKGNANRHIQFAVFNLTFALSRPGRTGLHSAYGLPREGVPSEHFQYRCRGPGVEQELVSAGRWQVVTLSQTSEYRISSKE